ncbi:hypothetical protein [Sphingomonas koreensis]
MLNADEPISILIEKLDALAKSDRVAILKRLSPSQRQQIDRLRANGPFGAAERHSPELLERFAQLDSGASPLTLLAREALRRAARPIPPSHIRSSVRGASLADAAGGLFKKLARA